MFIGARLACGLVTPTRFPSQFTCLLGHELSVTGLTHIFIENQEIYVRDLMSSSTSHQTFHGFKALKMLLQK